MCIELLSKLLYARKTSKRGEFLKHVKVSLTHININSIKIFYADGYTLLKLALKLLIMM